MRGPLKIALGLGLVTACIDVAESGSGDDTGTKLASVVQDVGGVVSAEIQADSSNPQQINASAGSGIVGAAVLFPPGSLKSKTTVKLEQGESLLHPDLPSQLGLALEQNMSEATRAIVVTADNDSATADAFAMALPLIDNGSSALAEPDLGRIAIVYLASDPARQRRVIGIIPPKEVTVIGRRLHFMTKLFGLYQGTLTSQVVADRSELSSTRKILTSQMASTLPGVTWSPIAISIQGRNLQVSGVPSGLLGEISCAATLVSMDSGKILIAAKIEVGSGKLVLGDKHTGEARLRVTCTEENGRTSTSPWSDPIELPAPEST